MKRRLRLLPLLPLLAVPLVACAPSLPERPEDRPATLIFTVDGLDWDLLLPAMREGRAPNLLDLARRGSAARLSTLNSVHSPSVWTSIATGKDVQKHGTTRFAWNILGEAGHSVGVVGWPVTGPAETSPEQVTEFRTDRDAWATSDRVYQAAAEEIIKSDHPMVMAVHQGALDGGTTGQSERDLSAVLEDIDAAFGHLRALMPPDTDIMVISGYGAGADTPDGIWISAGPSFRAPKPPFRVPDRAEQLPRLGDDESPGVLNILPTILHIRGLAVADDMDGQVMTSILIGGTGGHPVRTIATYEPESLSGTIPGPFSVTAGDDTPESHHPPDHLE